MAEAYYNTLIHPHKAISAGIDDVALKYDGHPTKEIVDIMLEEGIDISNQRIKQIRPSMTLEASKVVVLCSRELCPPFLLEHDEVTFIKVEDPYQLAEGRVRIIRNCIKEIVLTLGEQERVNQ